MSNLKLPTDPNQRTLRFLKQNPSISQSLLQDVEDLSQVETLIKPALMAQSRCEISPYYIQAVTTGRTAFLTTNLPDIRATHVTEVSTSWLIGRNRSCPISIQHSSISRCHAVVGHCTERGFYVMDVGSSNGTLLNRRRLVALERQFLNDGDLIELSSVRLEFFISGWKRPSAELLDTHVN